MTQDNLFTNDPLQDGISSVQLVDHMGSDLTVVNAARVSMDKESAYVYDSILDRENLPVADVRLINYLAKHGHWTPFSQPQIQLRIKMPIFVARQWFKHQVGYTRNEVSRRYVSTTPELYTPKEWRMKADNVKQGSSDDVYKGHPKQPRTSFSPNGVMNIALRMYDYMIDEGICPEQARMVLPQSMYTEFVETGSLAAYARLAKLRLDPHAQKEVREYAKAVSDIIQPLFPFSWSALSQ